MFLNVASSKAQENGRMGGGGGGGKSERYISGELIAVLIQVMRQVLGKR